MSWSISLILISLRLDLLLNPELDWWLICLSNPLVSLPYSTRVEEAFGHSIYMSIGHLCSGSHGCASNGLTLSAFDFCMRWAMPLIVLIGIRSHYLGNCEFFIANTFQFSLLSPPSISWCFHVVFNMWLNKRNLFLSMKISGRESVIHECLWN